MSLQQKMFVSWEEYYSRHEKLLINNLPQVLVDTCIKLLYSRNKIEIPYSPLRLPKAGDKIILRLRRPGIIVETSLCYINCESKKGMVTYLDMPLELSRDRGILIKLDHPPQPRSCVNPYCPLFPEEISLLVNPWDYKPDDLIRLILDAGEFTPPCLSKARQLETPLMVLLAKEGKLVIE